jgi:hypothetical protein
MLQSMLQASICSTYCNYVLLTRGSSYMAVLAVAVSPTWLFVADGISYMSAFGMLYAFISSVWFLQVPFNIAVLVDDIRL